MCCLAYAFMVFAAVILLMVWFVQVFRQFTYYERMMAGASDGKLGNYYSCWIISMRMREILTSGLYKAKADSTSEQGNGVTGPIPLT